MYKLYGLVNSIGNHSGKILAAIIACMFVWLLIQAVYIGGWIMWFAIAIAAVISIVGGVVLIGLMSWSA